MVNNQIGTSTYTYDLARFLIDMCETENYGHYYAINEGRHIYWYGFFCEKRHGLGIKVILVTTDEYGLSKVAHWANNRWDKSGLVDNGFNHCRLGGML